MAIKPTHAKKVAALLEEGDYDTSLDMAKAIIALVDELRAEDTTYLVVSQFENIYMGIGPYPTWNKAQKAAESGKLPFVAGGAGAIVPVRHPDKVAEQQVLLDDVTSELPLGHWARLRVRAGV